MLWLSEKKEISMEDKITLADIQEAIALVKKERPNETIEFFWGWLEVDSLGWPVRIKFKEEQIKEFKKITKQFNKIPPMFKLSVINEIFGMKIVNQIPIDDFEFSLEELENRDVKHLTKWGDLNGR